MNPPDIKLVLKLEGVSEFEGDMKLGSFIEKLNALKSGLAETDNIMTGSDKQSVDYVVSDLSHNSPATIGISPFRLFEDAPDPRALITYFVDAFGMIREKKQRPIGATDRLLKAMRKLADGAGETYERMILSISGGRSVALDRESAAALDSLLPEKRHSYGTVKGVVKRYHGDGTRPYFSVFLPVNGHQVKCVFPQNLFEKAAGAVERNASIDGELTYYEGEAEPIEIKVHNIRVHKKDAELPTLSSLTGVAPNATGDMSAAEFIRSLRNGW